MNQTLLQQAIQCLAIQNVSLRQARLDLAEGFDPALASGDLLVQFRATAKHVREVEYQSEGGSTQRHFQVDFECGLRLADPALIQDGQPDTGHMAEIQALFRADYLIKPESQPDKAALDAFASVNVGYHVWPYWREYLQSNCSRVGLPLIALPMYTVPQQHQAAKKAPRRKKAGD